LPTSPGGYTSYQRKEGTVHSRSATSIESRRHSERAGPRRRDSDESLGFLDDPDELDEFDDDELLPDEVEEYVPPATDPEEDLLTSP
jgi:hypothetical protein